MSDGGSVGKGEGVPEEAMDGWEMCLVCASVIVGVGLCVGVGVVVAYMGDDSRLFPIGAQFFDTSALFGTSDEL